MSLKSSFHSNGDDLDRSSTVLVRKNNHVVHVFESVYSKKCLCKSTYRKNYGSRHIKKEVNVGDLLDADSPKDLDLLGKKFCSRGISQLRSKVIAE